MNIIARLEFELAYYDSTIQRLNHYTTKTPTKTEWINKIDHLILARKPDLVLINKKKELAIWWILLFQQTTEWKYSNLARE